MLEAIASGLAANFQPTVFLATTIGVIIGLVFGIVPGIGSSAAICICLPLTYKMEPAVALCGLMAINAVAATGGAITERITYNWLHLEATQAKMLKDLMVE